MKTLRHLATHIDTLPMSAVIAMMESIDPNGDYRANPAHGIDTDVSRDEAREIVGQWLHDAEDGLC